MTVPESTKAENNAPFYLCVVLCVLALVVATAFLAFSVGANSAKENVQTVVQPVAAPTPTPAPITTETKLITVSSCVAGGYGILATDGALYQALNYATWAQFEPRNTYSIVITDGKIVSAVLVAAHYYDGGIDYDYHNEYPRERYERSDHYRKDVELERMGNSAYGTYAWGAANPWK